MMSTNAYKNGYIHSTYPDSRHPASGQGAPRYTAQVGYDTYKCRTYIGAQRKITKLEQASQK